MEKNRKFGTMNFKTTTKNKALQRKEPWISVTYTFHRYLCNQRRVFTKRKEKFTIHAPAMFNCILWLILRLRALSIQNWPESM